MSRAPRILLPHRRGHDRRLDGWSWGWRDNRPTAREDEVPGTLAKEFDFTQMPIPPLILDPTP